MTKYRIVASDLDGTLLNSEMHVSRENWEAVRSMTEAGVYFVPSSGRALFEMPREVRDSPYVRYLIHSDGAGIYDKETGESIHFPMSRERSAALLEILSEYETDLSVRHEGHSYVDAQKNDHAYHSYHGMDASWEKYIYEFSESVKDLDSFCRPLDGIDMVCAFFHSEEEQDACRRRLERMGDYIVASSDRRNLEIIDRRAGKGNALLHLARRLGVERAQTIAVGDSPNDRNMIEEAGLGLAMGNACEELKKCADGVLCTNDGHVMRYIQKIIWSK